MRPLGKPNLPWIDDPTFGYTDPIPYPVHPTFGPASNRDQSQRKEAAIYALQIDTKVCSNNDIVIYTDAGKETAFPTSVVYPCTGGWWDKCNRWRHANRNHQRHLGRKNFLNSALGGGLTIFLQNHNAEQVTAIDQHDDRFIHKCCVKIGIYGNSYFAEFYLVYQGLIKFFETLKDLAQNNHPITNQDCIKTAVICDNQTVVTNLQMRTCSKQPLDNPYGNEGRDFLRAIVNLTSDIKDWCHNTINTPIEFFYHWTPAHTDCVKDEPGCIGNHIADQKASEAIALTIQDITNDQIYQNMPTTLRVLKQAVKTRIASLCAPSENVVGTSHLAMKPTSTTPSCLKPSQETGPFLS
jgi:hypothetical protein